MAGTVKGRSMEERVAECLARGGFIYRGQDWSGRDLYDYIRVDVEGVSYRLETLGVVAWNCTCPAAKKDADGRCKHQIALERDLIESERRRRASRAAKRLASQPQPVALAA